MAFHREAFFVDDGQGGQRYCLLTLPAAAVRGAVLYVPPFAEEMNKSRRMATLSALAFAEAGYVVLQSDPRGCGDSSGGFGDATWSDWIADVDRAWRWIADRFACVRHVWALRAGGLVVSEWLKASRATPPLLLWQPVLNGRTFLNQFLRIRAARELFAETAERESPATLRERLDRGQTLEIAGYALTQSVARGLDEATLDLPEGYPAPTRVIEVSAGSRSEPTPAVASLAQKWRARGTNVECATVTGPPFWQTQEIEVATALIDASIEALNRQPTA